MEVQCHFGEGILLILRNFLPFDYEFHLPESALGFRVKGFRVWGLGFRFSAFGFEG